MRTKEEKLKQRREYHKHKMTDPEYAKKRWQGSWAWYNSIRQEVKEMRLQKEDDTLS